MPRSQLKSGTSRAGFDWTGLTRIIAIQVAVLLALLAAAVWYINWSSDAALNQFMNTGELWVDPPHHAQSPLATNSERGCKRRASI